MDTNKTHDQLSEIAARIKEMREVAGMSAEETAAKTEVSLEEYNEYESGRVDLPFTFIYKCAHAFNIGITDLLEGDSAEVMHFGFGNPRIARRIPLPRPSGGTFFPSINYDETAALLLLGDQEAISKLDSRHAARGGETGEQKYSSGDFRHRNVITIPLTNLQE